MALSDDYFVIFFALLLSMLVNGQQFVSIPASSTSAHNGDILFLPQTPRYGTNGTLAVVRNPINYFHIFFPRDMEGHCDGWNSTGNQSLLNSCTLATNGSPFSFTSPSCMGSLVSDGVVLSAVDGTDVSQVFGLTQKGEFVLGTLTAAEIISMRFSQLITGFSMIVLNGTVVVGPGGEIAPRTAIGVDKSGRLLLFVADGIEATNVGLTTEQLAKWMQSLGAYHVLNLDGGGSSVMMYKERQVTYPHCNDQPLPICQRRVTTIPCVM